MPCLASRGNSHTPLQSNRRLRFEVPERLASPSQSLLLRSTRKVVRDPTQTRCRERRSRSVVVLRTAESSPSSSRLTPSTSVSCSSLDRLLGSGPCTLSLVVDAGRRGCAEQTNRPAGDHLHPRLRIPDHLSRKTLLLPTLLECYVKQSKLIQHEGTCDAVFPSFHLGPHPPTKYPLLTMCSLVQALRRSLKNGDKEKVNHISITPKSAIAIVPPKKVCHCAPHLRE